MHREALQDLSAGCHQSAHVEQRPVADLRVRAEASAHDRPVCVKWQGRGKEAGAFIGSLCLLVSLVAHLPGSMQVDSPVGKGGEGGDLAR